MKRASKYSQADGNDSQSFPMHLHGPAKIGSGGEEAAAEYLETQGLSILDRNVSFPCGEIDIIAQDRDTVVFVEVKSRSGTLFGAAEAVSNRKFQRMKNAALRWLSETGSNRYRSIRFDVVVVFFTRSRVSSIDHYEGVDHGAR